MKLYSHVVLIAALAVPAFCQEPSPDAVKVLTDQADQMARSAEKMATDAEALSSDKAIALEDRMSRFSEEFNSDKLSMLEAQASAAADKIHLSPDLDDNLSKLKMQIDSMDLSDMKAAAIDMANQVQFAFQSPTPKPFPPDAPPAAPMPPMPPKGRISMRDGDYDAGTRALDQRKYDEAVQRFDSVINAKSIRADGALYWKAWALNRAGKREEALAAIAQLRRDYASSAYLNDAQSLEAEVKQNAGQPVSPAQETNDDLKLLAINSLMGADADRAIPLIEGILKGSSAPNVKDRALFVLAQSRAPRAQQVLADYAKGSGNPDMQLRAIQYVGMSGTRESQQLLAGIYSSSSDARVKNSIIQNLMNSHANDALLNIAKTEKDVSLRDSAIRDLASGKGAPLEGLLELYAASDVQAKRAIVEGFSERRDAKTLVDLARKETDPAMKRYIVERLSEMRNNKEALDYMMELLK